MHKQAIQWRQDLSQNAHHMKLSPVDLMYDIMATRERKAATIGEMSVQQTFEYYNEGIRYADSTEAVKYEFVDNAMTVYKRLIAPFPQARELVDSLECHIENPMDSIYKWAAIVKRASTPEYIIWCVHWIVDLFLSKGIFADQLSLRNLEGKAKGSGGKGIVDVVVMKKDLRDLLRGAWLEAMQWSVAQKTLIKDLTETIDSFRKLCGYMHNSRHRQVDFAMACNPCQQHRSVYTIARNPFVWR